MNPHRPFQLAAVDMDDTLLGPDKEISPENRAAVARLQATGIQVLLASGRRHENLRGYLDALELSGPVISCNGALVRVDPTGEIWHERRLPAALAEEILRDGDRRGVTQNFYHSDGAVYVAGRNAWTDLYERRTRGTVTPVGALQGRFERDAPLKILWIDAPEVVLTLAREAAARYDERLGVVVTDPEYLEFLPPGADKADALQVVARRLRLDASAVVAFGDGHNDIGMLRWAGLGIAMDHGRPAAHAAADRVAPPGDPATAFARAVTDLLG